jgi:hypothetical protein
MHLPRKCTGPSIRLRLSRLRLSHPCRRTSDEIDRFSFLVLQPCRHGRNRTDHVEGRECAAADYLVNRPLDCCPNKNNAIDAPLIHWKDRANRAR